MPPIDVILNAAGGSFVEGETDRMIADAFAERNVAIDLHLAKSGAEVDVLAEKAVKSDSETIVVGGGDGTISSVAAKVSKAGKTLGLLPIGTLNHFCKDLAIPMDLTEAIAVIADGYTIKVDLGEVNARTFINNSSIGLYPRIVRRRDHQIERIGRGKWSAAFFAAVRVFRRHSFFRVRFEIDGKRFLRKTPFVFVGNNEYGIDLYNIGSRESLTDAALSAYFLKRSGRWGVLILVLRTLFGRLKQWKDFESIKATEITIDVKKKNVMVAFDGEVAVMETPLEYRILPKALNVIVPKPDA